jgi:hypothetical protein
VVEGRSYGGEEEVSREVYQASVRGDSCAVTYLPSRPQVHCLGSAGQRLQAHDRATLLCALLSALALGGCFGGVEFAAKRELQLARLGEAAEGRVLRRDTTASRDRITYWVIYTFEVPGALATTGRVRVSRALWDSLQPLTPVTILYDPEHPRRHHPSFAFRLVAFLPEEAGGGDR